MEKQTYNDDEPDRDEAVDIFEDDEDEDFDEDAEAKERYPWLYDDEPAADETPGYLLKPEQKQAFDNVRANLFARSRMISENGTNYHHLHELTDEHLPELDFLRYNNLFKARTANAFLKMPLRQRARRLLFGNLWHEGELLLLFADTGLGKSALAVQIAQGLAGGEQLEPFAVTTPPQRVLYFDFELSDKDFAARYSDPDSDMPEAGTEELFPANFIRCSPREEALVPEEFADHQEFLIHSITDAIDFTGARVIIVDNVTWLSESTEHTAPARRLMRTLVDLKNRLGLSILVIAHTPKMRRGLPLELNHLQGSKMLANFADSILAIGKSCRSSDLRYLKPLKQRNSAMTFDDKHLPVLRLAREGRMLGFTFVDFEAESQHLEGKIRGLELLEAIRRDRMARTIELANGGKSVRKIAEKLGIGIGTVSRYLKNRPELASGNGEKAENSDKCSTVFHAHAPPVEHLSDVPDTVGGIE